MIRGNIIKALFAGYLSNNVEVDEHICAYPYRDATRIKTPIKGRGYTHVYIAEEEKTVPFDIDPDRTIYYCVYHPEITKEFPDGYPDYPEWATVIARRTGAKLDKEKGVYMDGVELVDFGSEIWDVAYATARLYIRLDEIKEGETP